MLHKLQGPVRDQDYNYLVADGVQQNANSKLYIAEVGE